MIDWIVDRYHVGTPEDEIARDFLTRCRKARLDDRATARVVRRALARHRLNRRLYTYVTGSIR